MAEAKIIVGAQDNASRVLSQVRTSMATLQDTSAKLTGALGALGLAGSVSIGGLALLATNAINSLDALNDLKDATGASIENISALEDVAKRTGTSFDTVGTSLIKFNAALKESKPGSDAEAALKAIGLSAQELKKIDPAEALLKTATALAGFADDGNKARLTQELFGKSLKEVAPFLKDLAEKGALNATVTTAQAEAAEAFNKQLFALKKNTEDAARAIVGDLLPALNKLLGNYIQLKEQGLFGTILKDAAKDIVGLGKLTNDAGADINKLMTERTKLQEDYNKTLAYEEKYKGKNRDSSKAIQEEIDATNKLLSVSRIRQAGNVNINPADAGDAISRKTAPRASVNFTGAAKKDSAPKSEQIDESRRSLAQYVEGLSKALDTTQQLTESEKALNFLRGQGVQGQIPQVRELVLGLAAQIDKEKELTEALKANRDAASAAGDAITARNEKYQTTLAGLIAATPTANLEKQRADIALLTEEFERFQRTLGEYGISEQTYLEAVSARLDLTAEKLKDTKSIAEELGLTFASSFEDAITSGKDLQGVINAIGQDIGKLLIRKTVTEPASKFLSKGIDSLFGDLFSGLGFAAGGSPPVGQYSLVGEKGPELFMPTVPGTIVPNSQLGGGGSTSNVTYIFNGGVSRQEVMSGLQQVRAAAVGDVVDGQKRRRF